MKTLMTVLLMLNATSHGETGLNYALVVLQLACSSCVITLAAITRDGPNDSQPALSLTSFAFASEIDVCGRVFSSGLSSYPHRV